MGEESKKGRRKKEIGYNSVFAKRLRDLMEENNTTQPQLAEAVGVSRQAIGQWKDGNTVPDILDFQKIADYFNVSADYLLGRSKSRSYNNDISDVSNYLGISNNAVMAICQMSGAKSAEEVEAWINDNSIDIDYGLENGINSDKADICSWIILNILIEANYAVGTLLTQMYCNDNYGGVDYATPLAIDKSTQDGFTIYAHYLINLFAERCKYSIDSMLVESNKKCNEKLYCSIFGPFKPNMYGSPIDEIKEQFEKYSRIFPL